MPLTRDREPVEVFMNPRSACWGAKPRWLTTRRYIVHRDGYLTWLDLASNKRHAQPKNWRKVKHGK